uniref:Protein kinase domain-containing protein n=2 Tax=Meloidogyne incognita TaxID=6306 RepID=A0A914MC41_MELIC
MDWKLAHHDLELRKELGRGAFGVVRLGILKKNTSVAVKESFEDSLELFKEGRIMKTLFHENIVNLIGITLDKAPILLVTEYCPKSPEVIQKKILSKKSDVWSFGVLCFEIFEGQEPYKDIPNQEAVTKLVNGQFLVFSKKRLQKILLQILLGIFL